MGSGETGKSSQWIEQQQVETGMSALQELAKHRKKGFSLVDAIATMMPGIEKSFAAGYTHQEICDTLKEKAGIAIAPSTLKLYINRIRKEKENRKEKVSKPKVSQKQQPDVIPEIAVESVPKPSKAKQALAHHFNSTKSQPTVEQRSGFVEMPDVL
jgi:hypothetical protein